ncbi:Ankyrin repeat and LEM domain-containing protein 1 [Oopsacas minuta]|uniref:Ankyrin repeat and LEM domain-containing protein 1 n=1 Tax=Oopsacas minuta TaxID=111878 RepID=A0AAV7K5K0_9METZ|nr:Ankyrin repeat and LEM domain-containing protein 1 [Oopsacas minuta]
MEYDSDSYYFPAEESVRSQGEALLDATVSFNLRSVLKLLEAGIDPNEPVEDGITALHIAANSDSNRVYVLQALLDYEADPNIQSVDGETPLHVAASWGKLEAIKILLANNADPRVKDLSGKTPLDCCTEMKHKECTVYLREILQGRSIPRSVSEVFDEIDFESFELIDQTEEPTDIFSEPKFTEKSRYKNKNEHKGSFPTELDTSDEQFLSELTEVFKSDLVTDRDNQEYVYKKSHVSRATSNSRSKKKQSRNNHHQRSHSTPLVVSSTKQQRNIPRKILDISHPVCSDLIEDNEQDFNTTFTKEYLSIPSKSRMNDTFEILPELPVIPTINHVDSESDDVRPISPIPNNIHLADSDATLTVFNSDDSEFYPIPPARKRDKSKSTIPVGQTAAPESTLLHQDRFVKANELIARNSQNRVLNLYDVNQVGIPIVKPVNERQPVVLNRQVDKVSETARYPDKLSDKESPLIPVKQTKTPVSILKNTNQNHLNFSMSQPYSYNTQDTIDTAVEEMNSPLDKELSDEHLDKHIDYSQKESYIQPPDTMKKPLKQKIGEIVSKSKNINLKPKLTINKPNFFKSKEPKSNTKSTQSEPNNSLFQDLDLNYVNRSTYTSSVYDPHSPNFTEIGTQTIPELNSISTQKTTSSPKPITSKKSNTKPVITHIQEISNKLDRECMYNTFTGPSVSIPSPNMYPTLSEEDSDKLEAVLPTVSHKYSPSSKPHIQSTPPLNNKSDTSRSYDQSARKPDKPIPYANKRPQDKASNTAYTNIDNVHVTETPNSFSNPYLDTSRTTYSNQHISQDTQYTTEPISNLREYAAEPISMITQYPTEPISESRQHTPEPIARSKPYTPEPISEPRQYTPEPISEPRQYTPEPISKPRPYTPEPISKPRQYTPEPISKPRQYTPEPISKPRQYTPEPISQNTKYPVESISHPRQLTEPISKNTQYTPEPISKPRKLTAEPISLETSPFSLPTQSPNSFINLLEEVNKSLPYELQLSETPTIPKSPNPSNTPPPSIKHTGVPTPFIQTPTRTPPPSQALTPRSKRRVTIDPNPTDVQYCDVYDRTPVMPSLDTHISDDSDEIRDEIAQDSITSPKGAGSYVPPPPYQGAPADALDSTFDLDPSCWKDSPTYIGLDEYLQQQTQEHMTSSSPSIPDLHTLSDQQLREELIKIGEQPGPITEMTRTLYLRYLSKVKQDPTLQSSNCFQGYLYELAQVLTGSMPIPNKQELENDMCNFFDNPPTNCTWREGITKESFNYILIDPRISQNLPSLIADLSELDRFRIFIESIFYVGKGKRSRPYSHLYEAISYENNMSQANRKQQRILDIWSSGHGVVSLHCFQGIIAVEAFSREACLLEAIGLHKLTNTKRGEYYGVVSEWEVSKKRLLGVYLLHRAMHILIAEGERQICRQNLTK